MRTQWTTKGNQDASSSCSCDWGLHRYLRNFGGGWTPQTTPLGTPLLGTLFPNTVSLCSPLHVWDQVSQPHKTI